MGSHTFRQTDIGSLIRIINNLLLWIDFIVFVWLIKDRGMDLSNLLVDFSCFYVNEVRVPCKHKRDLVSTRGASHITTINNDLRGSCSAQVIYFLRSPKFKFCNPSQLTQTESFRILLDDGICTFIKYLLFFRIIVHF